MTIFSTPECGQSVVFVFQKWWFSCFDFDPLLGLTLEVFWEPKWRPKPSKMHLKNIKKNDAQDDPKLVPKGVPKWSQNRQKWGLGTTLFQGWLPSGLQSPSRIDFGLVLGSFWNHFRQFFWYMFCDFCLHSLASCYNQRRLTLRGGIRKNKQRGSEK